MSISADLNAILGVVACTLGFIISVGMISFLFTVPSQLKNIANELYAIRHIMSGQSEEDDDEE